LDIKTRKPKTDSPDSTQGTQGSQTFTLEHERIITETIGCAIDVHREIGAGFLEGVYHRAMCIALSLQGLRFSTEHPVVVMYQGHRVGFQRFDLVVEGTVIVEIKSVKHLDFVHKAQLLSYLRASKLRAGLLFNFNAAPLLIRRVVL
jgi:GxxExxY protein